MDAITIPVTTADQLLAARVVMATATVDALQLDAVLNDIHTSPRDGGPLGQLPDATLPVMLAMSNDICTMAKYLDQDEWIESLRTHVLNLTRAVEQEGA